jgi:hypothetical protein
MLEQCLVFWPKTESQTYVPLQIPSPQDIPKSTPKQSESAQSMYPSQSLSFPSEQFVSFAGGVPHAKPFSFGA